MKKYNSNIARISDTNNVNFKHNFKYRINLSLNSLNKANYNVYNKSNSIKESNLLHDNNNLKNKPINNNNLKSKLFGFLSLCFIHCDCLDSKFINNTNFIVNCLISKEINSNENYMYDLFLPVLSDYYLIKYKKSPYNIYINNKIYYNIDISNYKLYTLVWAFGLLKNPSIEYDKVYLLKYTLHYIYKNTANESSLKEFIKIYIYENLIRINQIAYNIVYNNMNTIINGYLLNIELATNIKFIKDKIFSKNNLDIIYSKIISFFDFTKSNVNCNIFRYNNSFNSFLENLDINNSKELLKYFDFYNLRKYVYNIYKQSL